MAEVIFNRLGGDKVTAKIDQEMTVREIMEKNGMKYKAGDEIRVQGKAVDLDTKVTAEQATFITAIPNVKGGN